MPLTNGTLDRKAAKISGSYSTIYTVPTGKVAKIDALLISNLHVSFDFQVWVTATVASTDYDWISGARISGSSWEPGGRMPLILETKQTLKAGDLIKAKITAISQPSWVSTSQDAAICISLIEFAA